MRRLRYPIGTAKLRPRLNKVLVFLSIIAAAVLFAGVPVGGDAGQAQAGYSRMQSKLAGNYEGFRYSRPAKRAARRGKKTYKKTRNKKTYKKYRKGKRRYSRKKSYGKTAKRRKSKRTRAAKRYRYKKKHKKVAALGSSYQPKRKSLTGGGVRWVASAGCLNGTLKSIVHQVASKFGPVTVSSTCRSRKRNARVGGARRSQHLTGNAVDFRVHANHRAAYAYLKSLGSVGGYKHYGGGLFHIDVGPRRTW
jgi:Peptidase M15